ncbi:MAG: transglutaminase domain-containing protein [Candidatus Marinimicrobia bacterium]|nr:transglutaminase domain-containing protein [Candidatus Neomarinimicrobiota bacterium]
MRVFISKIIGICLLLLSCNPNENVYHKIPSLVTADIQAGIEQHIEKMSKLGDGFFKLNFENKELNLKLVKVHTEYLANLGPNEHFACVDLASTDGFVYDVDFFLEGEPGKMNVTETTIHKTNGQPLYLWEQKDDKTWHRVSSENAPSELLGVINEKDSFEFYYKATLPVIDEPAKMWIPLPISDQHQTVTIKNIESPVEPIILEEADRGNKIFFLNLLPEHSEKIIEISYNVDRLEKNVYEDNEKNSTRFLQPSQLVPHNESFIKIAQDVVKGKLGSLAKARALYDHTIEHMKYIKYGEGWGKGDAVYACDSRTGNCTDFHSYFIALAHAVDIPARFAIGASIPSERNEGGIGGYHCWAEFYSDGMWWPIDISEADKCSALSTYYFGHHPANRIEFSRGRDLIVEPSPESGPINFLAYPILEIGGIKAKAKVKFSFKRILIKKSDKLVSI